MSSNAWPGGLAYWLVDRLKDDCAPNDRMAEVERTRKLNQVKSNERENPAKLFEQIKSIDNQFSDLPNKLTEEAKIAVVLEKAANEYGVILANTAREKGTGLTVDHLEQAMKLQWRIQYGADGKNNKQNENGKEFKLVSFGGKCYHCGQTGHKANQCPNKDNDGKNQNGTNKKSYKFKGKCNNCGQVGHKAVDCW